MVPGPLFPIIYVVLSQDHFPVKFNILTYLFGTITALHSINRVSSVGSSDCRASNHLKQYAPARYRRGHINVSLFAFRQMACHEMIRFDLAEYRFLASATVCRIRTAGSKTAAGLRVDRGSDLTL